jgi:cytochrome c
MWMRTALIVTAFIAATVTAPVHASTSLARSKNCLECHAVDKEITGPSFTAVAKRYKGIPNAEQKLAENIKKGCADHWGPNVMPPAGMGAWKVSDGEAKKLARWILGL